MDIDVESVEIVFAQKLACGEPPVRARALEQLTSWIKVQSKSTGGFNEASLLRLSKGLHYVFWMQDKPLLQEELAGKIAGLLSCFRTHDQAALFLHTLIIALSKQWPSVDRWRMDKFLMLMRRILRTTFACMSELKWDADASKYFDVLRQTVITSDSTVCDAIKFHFASMFLDELDLAGAVPIKTVTDYLRVYADVLVEKSSGYLFESFTDEIFNAVLQEKAERIDQEEEASSDDGGVKIDYAYFGELFFELGKKPTVNAKRRERLYKLSDQFKLAAREVDPFYKEPKIKSTEEAPKRQMRKKKKKRSVGVSKKIQKKEKKGTKSKRK